MTHLVLYLLFRLLKKEFISGLILLLTFQVHVHAQQREEDSCGLLSQTKNDLSRVGLLISWANWPARRILKSRQYGQQALRLAAANGYKQEICDAYNLLGGIFHQQSAYDLLFTAIARH